MTSRVETKNLVGLRGESESEAQIVAKQRDCDARAGGRRTSVQEKETIFEQGA